VAECEIRGFLEALGWPETPGALESSGEALESSPGALDLMAGVSN